MISARRAALLGLAVPLSAIMLAVLGLWPEEEEETAAELPVYYGSGRAYRGPYARKQEDGELEQHVRESWDWIERVKADQAARAEHEAAREAEITREPAPQEPARPPTQEIVTSHRQEIVTRHATPTVPVLHGQAMASAQEHSGQAAVPVIEPARRRQDTRALLLILAECV